MSADRVGAGLNTVSTNGGSTITPSTASVKGLVIKQQTSQSGNLLEIDDTANTELVTVRADGTTVIDVSSSVNAGLRITQRGSSDAFVVEDSANPDSTPLVVDTSGRLIVGSTSAVVEAAGILPYHQVVGTTTSTARSILARFSDDSAQGVFSFTKSRGTSIGTNAIVTSGDDVGSINFRAADGNVYPQVAAITATVDGTPGLNDMPGRLTFSTTSDGSNTSIERMRITSAGRVGIGLTNPSQQFSVSGDIEIRNNNITPPTIHFTSQDSTTNIWQIDAQVSDVTNGQLQFINNGTERMRINSVGDIQVSTAYAQIFGSAGNGNWHIRGKYTGSSPFNNELLLATNYEPATNTIDNAFRGTAMLSVDAFNGGGAFKIYTSANNNVAPTERMRIDSSGNVGIGVTNPGLALDVAGSIRAVTPSGTSPAIRLVQTANQEWRFSIPAGSSNLSLNDSTTERMRIDTNGLITGSGTSLGAWTEYTPTLGGTGWAIGDGTVNGVYCQIGKVVHFRVQVTFGATSTFGAASALQLTTPVSANSPASPANQANTMKALARDVSAGAWYTLAVRPFNASTTACGLFVSGTNGLNANTTSTAPFTWASGDIVYFSGTYEIA